MVFEAKKICLLTKLIFFALFFHFGQFHGKIKKNSEFTNADGDCHLKNLPADENIFLAIFFHFGQFHGKFKKQLINEYNPVLYYNARPSNPKATNS